MKTIAVLLVALAACVAAVHAQNYYNANGKPVENGKDSVLPAPPCPKNYLFSCQPNLAAVPCASSSIGGAGNVGAYSEYVPTIANAPYNYHGLTQNQLQYPNYYYHHH